MTEGVIGLEVDDARRCSALNSALCAAEAVLDLAASASAPLLRIEHILALASRTRQLPPGDYRRLWAARALWLKQSAPAV